VGFDVIQAPLESVKPAWRQDLRVFARFRGFLSINNPFSHKSAVSITAL